MEIVVITYRSALDIDEVERRFRAREEAYRDMDGLLQKFYLHNEETDQVGGIYVFDSPASRDRLFETDVNATLRDAYEVEGDIEVSTYHVVFPLYELGGRG